MTAPPPRPTRRPPAASARAPRLTLGKLALFVSALIVLAWWLGRSKPAQVERVDVQAAAADTRTMPTAPPPSSPHIVRGEKATTLRSVDRARMTLHDGGTVLSVVGGVGREFHTDLAAIIAANPGLQRIDITSGGGYTMVGYEAARLIARNNLLVRVKSHCASICVALWAAASQRQLEANAVIGLHQWTAQCDVMTGEERRQCERVAQFATEVSTTYEAWLRSAGFSPRLIALQAATAAEDVAVLRADQLAAEGVDFTVVAPQGR